PAQPQASGARTGFVLCQPAWWVAYLKFRAQMPARNWSRYRKQFHFEDKRGVRRDRARITFATISFLRRNGKARFFTDLQGRDAFVPTLDDLARAEDEREGVVAINGTVELGTIREPAGVMDGDGIAGLGRSAAGGV